jgi:hypothetical protein
MHLHTKTTRFLKNTPVLIRRIAYFLARKNTATLSDELRREMYGMDMREQLVINQVISMAGQVIALRQNTVGITKKNKYFLLEEGSQVKISKNPFMVDQEGNVYVIVLDKSYKYLAIRLTDYITDVHVSSQG